VEAFFGGRFAPISPLLRLSDQWRVFSYQ